MATNMKFPVGRMAGIKMAGGIREIMALSEKMAAEGRDIVHMDIGRTDFPSPECAVNKAVEAAKAGFVHYTDMAGIFELRDEIAKKYRTQYNLDVTADDNVVVTQGATEALTDVAAALFDFGDEMIIPAPYFPPYVDQAIVFGIVPVIVQSKEENNFCLTGAEIEAAITPKTRAVMLNCPNNPSGAVMTRAQLEDIARVAIKHDLWVISDECYETFVYDGEYTSIAALPGMAERTVIVASASKTWSMTGWRVGWVVCPAQLRPYVNKCHQNIATCANSFAQKGVVEAFKHADADVAKMVVEYRRRRDMVYKWLSETKGIKIALPQGAFYAFPNIKSFGMDGLTFCYKLLEEKGVSATPGEAFGMPGYIRLAYCQDYDYIEKGMARIKEFCEQL